MRANNRMRNRAIALSVISLGGIALLQGLNWHNEPADIRLEVELLVVPADGSMIVPLTIHASDDRIPRPDEVEVRIVEGAGLAHLMPAHLNGNELIANLVAGVRPGDVVIEARANGSTSARQKIHLELVTTDTYSDGMPDFIRLDSEPDRESFRRWFTFLAEEHYFRSDDNRLPEVQDCSGLVRFAYREALREHYISWADDIGLDFQPPGETIRKYNYPHTPLEASLFRVRSGSFLPTDLNDGTFAQFADARTLRGLNSHFIGRDVALAQPGDLLFFEQLEQDLPFHMMIFAGESHFDPGPGGWLVYHTGPTGDGPGEIRRVRVTDLQNHPSARWRPFPGNPNFLGVYRWNILRTAR